MNSDRSGAPETEATGARGEHEEPARAPLLVVAGIMIEGGRVLLTRRPRGTHLENLWEFPGGKVEPGESPQAALARELHEELGVEAAVEQIVECTFWRYPSKDVLLLFFAVKRRAGAIANRGVAAHVWVGLDDLDRYEMPPADVPVLARVRVLLGAASG